MVSFPCFAIAAGCVRSTIGKDDAQCPAKVHDIRDDLAVFQVRNSHITMVALHNLIFEAPLGETSYLEGKWCATLFSFSFGSFCHLQLAFFTLWQAVCVVTNIHQQDSVPRRLSPGATRRFFLDLFPFKG